jgi:hypothetical protein
MARRLVSDAHLERLPAYAIARCPYCQQAIVERVDTYTAGVLAMGHGTAILGAGAIVRHCPHFAFSHVFYHFYGLPSSDALHGQTFPPEVPFVVGDLLKRRTCQAVIHALPVCRIENDEFVPRFNMFPVVYFSRNPAEAYKAMIRIASIYPGAEGYATDFRLPPENAAEGWWNLRPWVDAGQLHWLDPHDPEFALRTSDAGSFPYGEIDGRRTMKVFGRTS